MKRENKFRNFPPLIISLLIFSSCAAGVSYLMKDQRKQVAPPWEGGDCYETRFVELKEKLADSPTLQYKRSTETHHFLQAYKKRLDHPDEIQCFAVPKSDVPAEEEYFITHPQGS